jgi:hypothetical protein
MLGMGDLFQVSPEVLFKADAGPPITTEDFITPRAQNQPRTEF